MGGTAAAGVGGGSRGSVPGGGELPAEDCLVPSGRHAAVPAAPEPERPLEAPVRSARWGPADARNLQPTCLPICPPTRRSGEGSCAPKGPGKTCQGVWVPSGPCLRLPALGRGYGRGVLRLLFSREESAPSPPQPSLQGRLGRPGRPQVRGRAHSPGCPPQPAPRTPQTAAGGSRLQVWGPAGEGAFPKGRRGPSRSGGRTRGRDLGAPVFSGAGGGVITPTPAERPTRGVPDTWHPN